MPFVNQLRCFCVPKSVLEMCWVCAPKKTEGRIIGKSNKFCRLGGTDDMAKPLQLCFHVSPTPKAYNQVKI